MGVPLRRRSRAGRNPGANALSRRVREIYASVRVLSNDRACEAAILQAGRRSANLVLCATNYERAACVHGRNRDAPTPVSPGTK